MQKVEAPQKSNDILKGFVTIAVSGLAIYGTYKLLTDGKKYLNHNNADQSIIKKASIDLFVSESKEADINKRLHKIGLLIKSKDPIEREAGALLFCSTYESSIRNFCVKMKIEVTNKDSIISLARKLRSKNYINRVEFDSIKTFVNDFRNKVMHGLFQEVDLQLVRDLKLLK